MCAKLWNNSVAHPPYYRSHISYAKGNMKLYNNFITKPINIIMK